MDSVRSRKRSYAGAIVAGTVLLAASLVTTPGAAQVPGPGTGPQRGRGSIHNAEKLGYLAPKVRRTHRSLRRALGPQGVVELDPVSGSTRVVARLDGYLTAPNGGPARAIVLRYLRDHAAVFSTGSTRNARLRFASRQMLGDGVVRLHWLKTHSGIPVLDQGVSATVSADGRVINLLGNPTITNEVTTTRFRIGRQRALRLATPGGTPTALNASGPQGALRATAQFLNGRSTQAVLFPAPDGLRTAWRVISYARSGELIDSVVDGTTGDVLRRHSLTNAVDALVFENSPGAAEGGAQHEVDISRYVAFPGFEQFFGNFAYAFTDVNDDRFVQTTEDIPPSGGVDYLYPYTSFSSVSGGNCALVPLACSWDFNTAFSWEANREQNATQLFYFVNQFHDHLSAAPIGFNKRTKKNFEGTSRVWVSGNTGANTASGLPDVTHVNNAFMSTPPKGPPLMEMYLTRPVPGTPFPSINTGDDPTVVYHEYTHGLSNRLVADPFGVSSLVGHQSESMGEGWSDWYALDFLVKQGLVADSAAPGEVVMADYVGGGQNLWRTQALDCPVGSAGPACPGTPAAGTGGYTYGDLGLIDDGPETHADGEIWAEALWDLRRRLIADHGAADGVFRAELLITRAMELSPNEPTFLDMRNAILQADTVFNGGSNRAAIWDVFAERGMGFFASTATSPDVRPVEDFSRPPPAGGPTGTLTGTVTTDWGTPVVGAEVVIGGHASGFGVDLRAITDGEGAYAIADIPAGTYPRVIVSAGGGFDSGVAGPITIAGGSATTQDLSVTRNWALLEGGSRVATADGEDYSPDCGPAGAIDGSHGTQWLTSSPAFAGDPGPEFFTVELPNPVDISSFAIDPTNGCGGGSTASLGEFMLEVSTDGIGYETAATGTFTDEDRWRRNFITPLDGSATNVRFVRLTGLSTLNSDPGFTGARYLNVTELQVYGEARSIAKKVGSVLRYDAAPGQANDVSVTTAPGALVVSDATNAVVPGTGCSASTPNVVTCASKGIKSLSINTGDGDDEATVFATTRAVLSGGPGGDTISGGSGADTLDGGPGPDVMSGGGGVDTVTYSSRSTPVVVDVDGAADDGGFEDGPAGGTRDNVMSDIENIVGGSGADTLIGSAADNVLDGGIGPDVLRGLAGQDSVSYGGRRAGVTVDLDGVADDGGLDDGNQDNVMVDIENIVGGVGPDILKGNAAQNVLTGGKGNDTLDAVDGTPLVDQLLCGVGTDKFRRDSSDVISSCETPI